MSTIYKSRFAEHSHKNKWPRRIMAAGSIAGALAAIGILMGIADKETKFIETTVASGLENIMEAERVDDKAAKQAGGQEELKLASGTHSATEIPDFSQAASKALDFLAVPGIYVGLASAAILGAGLLGGRGARKEPAATEVDLLCESDDLYNLDMQLRGNAQQLRAGIDQLEMDLDAFDRRLNTAANQLTKVGNAAAPLQLPFGVTTSLVFGWQLEQENTTLSGPNRVGGGVYYASNFNSYQSTAS